MIPCMFEYILTVHPVAELFFLYFNKFSIHRTLFHSQVLVGGVTLKSLVLLSIFLYISLFIPLFLSSPTSLVQVEISPWVQQHVSHMLQPILRVTRLRALLWFLCPMQDCRTLK